MTLHLYDTAARAVREFVPLVPGRVGIYLCGATVQAPPHIGHIRSGIAFDVLRRWLEAGGQQVTFIRNVTDIDDKILHNAGHEEIPFWALAARNELAFAWAYDVLGCLRPTYEPRATGHVPEMIVLMQRLIDAGHAYAAAGDVYFDVRSFADYGALSGQKVDDMLPAADSDASVKRDPHDFALWKGAKPDEPHWDTPWGKGRPGWHLECSAMAGRYLGGEFDIHGGGMDLLFPHHENEIAQSRAAGDGFARYWLHNAWVTTSGEKMSKSLGNSLLVSEVVRRVRPIELRYYLAGSHYRSHLEYSEESLQQAAAGFRRLEGFLQRAADRCGELGSGSRPAAFAAAMDDDLGVPAALAVIHEVATDGNRALDSGDLAAAAEAAGAVRAMLAVLGLDPFAEPWRSETGAGESDRLRAALDAVIGDLLAERATARAAKDFARADAIRDRLAAAGVSVEDGPAGARWTLTED